MLQVWLPSQSTAGGGGTVSYSYWTSGGWVAFTPVGGNYHLDTTDYDLLLWEDYHSIPGDWQKQAIGDGEAMFWITIQVNSDYSVGPVGSQITAVSDIRAIATRR